MSELTYTLGPDTHEQRRAHDQARQERRAIGLAGRDRLLFPDIADALVDHHQALGRVDDPVLPHADAQVLFGLLDVVASAAPLADHLDDQGGHVVAPDVAALIFWERFKIDRLVRMTIGLHPR